VTASGEIRFRYGSLGNAKLPAVERQQRMPDQGPEFVKVQCRWGTGARMLHVSFSPNSIDTRALTPYAITYVSQDLT